VLFQDIELDEILLKFFSYKLEYVNANFPIKYYYNVYPFTVCNFCRWSMYHRTYTSKQFNQQGWHGALKEKISSANEPIKIILK